MSQTVGPERAQRPGVGDRLARLQPRRTATLGLLLAIAAFAVYGLTAGTFSGYEDETAAVSAGLVEDGQLVVEPGNPISGQGIPGRDGRRYSRTGLTQPLIEAPFFAVGLAMDKISSTRRPGDGAGRCWSCLTRSWPRSPSWRSSRC